jgi:hypothetical protein
LQTTLKGLAEGEVPKSQGFRVSTEEASSARTGKSRLQRLKIFICKDHLNALITVIAQFLNLISLGFSNVVNTRLAPLRNLKHLENIVLKKSKFI